MAFAVGSLHERKMIHEDIEVRCVKVRARARVRVRVRVRGRVRVRVRVSVLFVITLL